MVDIALPKSDNTKLDRIINLLEDVKKGLTSSTPSSTPSKRRNAEQIAEAREKVAQQALITQQEEANLRTQLIKLTREELRLRQDNIRRAEEEKQRQEEEKRRYEESYKENTIYKSAQSVKNAPSSALTSIGISAATGGVINPVIAQALQLDKIVNAALMGLGKSMTRTDRDSSAINNLDKNKIPDKLDKIQDSLDNMSGKNAGEPEEKKSNKGFLGKILGALGGLVSTVVPSLLTLLPGAVMLLFPKISNLVEKTLNNMLSGIGMSEGTASTAAALITDFLPGALIGMKFGGFAGAIIGGIVTLIANNIDTLVKWFNDFVDTLGSSGVLQGLGGAFKGMFDIVYGIGEFFGGTVAWLVNTISTAAEFVMGIPGMTKRLWDNTTKFASETWDSTKKLASDTWTSTKNLAAAGWDLTTKAFSDVGTVIQNKATQVWGEIKEFAKDPWTYTKNLAKTTWDSITTAATSIWTDIKDWIKDKFGKAVQGFKEFCDDPLSFVKKKAVAVGEAVGEKVEAAGNYVLEKGTQLKDATKEIGNTVINWFKDKLGIAEGDPTGIAATPDFGGVPLNSNLISMNGPIPHSVLNNLHDTHDTILDPLQSALNSEFGSGQYNVRVTSSYRSPAYNRKIGGATNSRHLTGTAMDIQVPGLSNDKIIGVLNKYNIPFGRAIAEKNGRASWVHLEYSKGQSQRGVVASMTNGGSYKLETNGIASLDGQNSIQLAMGGGNMMTSTEPEASSVVGTDMSYSSGGQSETPVIYNNNVYQMEKSVYPVGDSARTLLFTT